MAFIQFGCPRCGATSRIDAQMVGQTTFCPHCRCALIVPVGLPLAPDPASHFAPPTPPPLPASPPQVAGQVWTPAALGHPPLPTIPQPPPLPGAASTAKPIAPTRANTKNSAKYSRSAPPARDQEASDSLAAPPASRYASFGAPSFRAGAALAARVTPDSPARRARQRKDRAASRGLGAGDDAGATTSTATKFGRTSGTISFDSDTDASARTRCRSRSTGDGFLGGARALGHRRGLARTDDRLSDIRARGAGNAYFAIDHEKRKSPPALATEYRDGRPLFDHIDPYASAALDADRRRITAFPIPSVGAFDLTSFRQDRGRLGPRTLGLLQ